MGPFLGCFVWLNCYSLVQFTTDLRLYEGVLFGASIAHRGLLQSLARRHFIFVLKQSVLVLSSVSVPNRKLVHLEDERIQSWLSLRCRI